MCVCVCVCVCVCFLITLGKFGSYYPSTATAVAEKERKKGKSVATCSLFHFIPDELLLLMSLFLTVMQWGHILPLFP